MDLDRDAAPRAESGTAAATALETLYTVRRGRMVALAYVLVGDAATAEDLVQDAFARAWTNRWRLRSPEAAEAYVRRAIVNLSRNEFRRRSRREPANPDSGADVLQTMHVRLELVEALRALPPRRRACVVLRYLEDLTEADTAAVLGVSTGTVKSQTHKALRQLADVVPVADDRREGRQG